jgi:nitrate reductase gamma subunit
MSNRTLFAVTPYVAAVCLVAVSLLRYLLARQAGPLTPRETSLARELFGGHRLWSLGMGGLAVGHAALLAFPALILAWNRSVTRLLALEAVFFAFGVMAFVGLLDLIVRQVRGPVARSRSSLADTAFLGLLLVQIVSGLSLASLYRWASSWSVVTITPYVQSLLRLQPEVGLLAVVPYVVKLHVFSGLVLVALFPFTHLLFAVLVPLDRAAGLLLAPLRRALMAGGRRLGEAARVGGRRLGLGEEEE